MIKKPIDTDRFSEQLRARAVDLQGHRLLMTNLHGSQQEVDLTEPANCNGFGRIRHFRLAASPHWPQNPLPIDPAQQALQVGQTDELRTQVFQNAACNWRCWYCFVDFQLLSANPRHAAFLTPGELIDLYLQEPNRPQVIDLTGGQPDLAPEWVPWMMRELRARGMEREVYLWSDDNLSNDYFWRFLSDEDIALICSYKHYGKVCCFKGFNATSFAFNTAAVPELFDRQFELVKRLLSLSIDLYCYATFTVVAENNIADEMARFVDRLQALHQYLPLRTVPLEIKVFGPTKARLNDDSRLALKHQQYAIDAWQRELGQRFSTAEQGWRISAVPLRESHRL